VGAILVYTISVPLSVPVTKKGRHWHLNLNQYRNTHFQTLNKAKATFHEIVKPRLQSLPRMNAVNLVYTLFPRNNQLCDTNNICSIVDKFFSDTLVSCGIIEDDNFRIVVKSTFEYGEIDKSDPRVEVTITPVDETTDETAEDDQTKRDIQPMQITIVQTEIEDAIRKHILSQVAVREGNRIDIDLRATRGAEGFQAIINIVPEDSAVQDRSASVTSTEASESTAAAAAQPARATRTRAAAAEPVAEPETVTAEGTGNADTEEATAATGKASSLFGNLKKPENTPAADATAEA
jgi:hypothetical protein